ncbi:MAG: hypothetical protein OEZ08_17705, partial [Betaproteobacteria bacterium]|nr:hypothetical protein [Betaproteobacteria bacterium]
MPVQVGESNGVLKHGRSQLELLRRGLHGGAGCDGRGPPRDGLATDGRILAQHALGESDGDLGGDIGIGVALARKVGTLPEPLLELV